MADQSNIQEQCIQRKEHPIIHDTDELQTEILTFHQFMQAMTGDEVHGIPIGKVEPIPGEQLIESRVRVTFEFDVVCNSEPIRNSGNDSDVQAHDMALLKSFLLTPQLVDMLIDKIGTEMGFNSPESFIQQFLPMINTDCHQLFSNAIESLSDENGEYWRDIRDAPKVGYETMLNICTEHIFECFSAKFVSSSYEIVDSTK